MNFDAAMAEAAKLGLAAILAVGVFYLLNQVIMYILRNMTKALTDLSENIKIKTQETSEAHKLQRLEHDNFLKMQEETLKQLRHVTSALEKICDAR